jgi:hypothetical protein
MLTSNTSEKMYANDRLPIIAIPSFKAQTIAAATGDDSIDPTPYPIRIDRVVKTLLK